MINILITEFIDPEALKILSKDFNVIYKKDIWENSDYLKKEINKSLIWIYLNFDFSSHQLSFENLSSSL